MISIPVLSQIPIIGPVLFRQTVLVYIMYVVVILLQIMVFRSRWGLRLRSVGEHPKAADTVGIKVNRTRLRATVLGGAVAGLGGAFFTVAAGLAFGKEMTNGKGYIALAAMILGRWSPKGALAAALLFGFANNLQLQLSIIQTPIPSQIMLMTPYIVTIFAVAGLVGRVRAAGGRGHPLHEVSDRVSNDIDWDALRSAATEVMHKAYAPYSHFPVGAAALVDDGRVVVGCNVENASYGVTLCAECALVSGLHVSGGGRLVAFTCVDKHGNVLMPCGRCRQLLWEHGGAAPARRDHARHQADDRGAARRVRSRRPGGARMSRGASTPSTSSSPSATGTA